MSPYRSIALVLVASACTRPAPTVAPAPAPAPVAATPSEPPPVVLGPDGKPDPFAFMNGEGFGQLHLGMTEAELLRVVPGAKPQSECAESWVDGGTYRWLRDAKAGVDVVIGCEGFDGVQSIRVTAPFSGASRRGIALGATAEAVTKAYANVLSEEDPPDADGIVAGSIYGGLVFTLENGKVTEMFLGAMAE